MQKCVVWRVFMDDLPDLLKNFLDGEGKLIRYPSKRRMKWLALCYLAEKFRPDTDYSEKEVNEILKTWNTFSDHVLLRRELYEFGFLDRERDGSCYRLANPQPDPALFA